MAARAAVVDWRGDAVPASLVVTQRRAGSAVAVDTIPVPTTDAAPDPALLARIARATAGRPVILRLPSPLLLERRVNLPLAAAREVDRVVGYEMDRLTPFRAEDVFWVCDDFRPDRARGQLDLRLSLIARAVAQPMLEALGRLGLHPIGLEVPRANDRPCLIALTIADRARQRREHTALALLGGVCAGLAVLALAIPFLRQARLEWDLDTRIAALRPRVAEVEALRTGIAAEVASRDVVAAERAAVGDPLAALATITTVLPDDGFLQEFSLAQRKLAVRGHAAAASRLIAALADDPAIRNPAFSAPVTRVENGQADIFSIRAEWGP